MSLKRITSNIFLSVFAEILNKATPLIAIYIIADKLGPIAFGEAQYSIALMEIAHPLIMLGYSTAGSILVGRHKDDPQYISIMISNMYVLKTIHLVIVIAGFWIALNSTPTQQKYIPAFLTLSFFLVSIVFELGWIFYATQKFAFIAKTQMLCKIPSLLLIIAFVSDSSDALLFACLVLAANSISSFITAYYGIKIYRLSKPSKEGVLELFNMSKPLALVLVMGGLIERIDFLLIEWLNPGVSAGIYTGQARILSSLNQIIVAVGAALYSEALSKQDPQQINKHAEMSLWLLLTLFLPISVGSFYVQGELVPTILGPSFSLQNYTLGIMSIGLIGNVMIFVFGTQFLVINGKSFQVGLCLLVGCLLFFGLGYFFRNENDFNEMLAWTGTTCKIVSGFLIMRIALKQLKLSDFSLLKVAAPTGVMFVYLHFTPNSSMCVEIPISICIVFAVTVLVNKAKVLSLWARFRGNL